SLTNKEQKILENLKSIINAIISVIEEQACYMNPGPAAVAAVEHIDSNYYLIPKSEFPDPDLFVLTDDPIADAKDTRSKGLSYLVVADKMERRDAEAKHRAESSRYHTYRELVGDGAMSFEDFCRSLGLFSRLELRAINEITNLRSQLEKK